MLVIVLDILEQDVGTSLTHGNSRWKWCYAVKCYIPWTSAAAFSSRVPEELLLCSCVLGCFVGSLTLYKRCIYSYNLELTLLVHYYLHCVALKLLV